MQKNQHFLAVFLFLQRKPVCGVIGSTPRAIEALVEMLQTGS
jgi:hypothetical protein